MGNVSLPNNIRGISFKWIGLGLVVLFLLKRSFGLIVFILRTAIRLIRPAMFVYGALKTLGIIGNTSRKTAQR